MSRYELNINAECNQNCFFCPVLLHPRNSINKIELKKTLRLLRNSDEVIISGGEPTLDKKNI